MTMLHITNCPHDEHGWCLECVRASANDYAAVLGLLRRGVETFEVCPERMIDWVVEVKDALVEEFAG